MPQNTLSTLPCATYRLQLTADFDFDAVAALAPYLKALGVSHVYASPITQARPGSTHGYDVIDHNRLNPELGGEEGFARLSDALRRHDLGLIVDFVPNHMAAATANPWWADVLRQGRNSPYATYFDIDWRRPPGFRHPAVTLPILGKSYGDVLRDGELHLENDGEHWTLAYFDHRLPVSADGEAFIHRHGAADIESSPDILHRLLRLQHYRLTWWRNAASEINYRRFFDINDLVGLRVERSEVFATVHRLVALLCARGVVQGLRLDHIDGLRDPAAYCARLSDLLTAAAKSSAYVIVEKILEPNEDLPEFPGVAGTTGYEWANLLTRCFVNDAGLRILNRFWREVAPGDDPALQRRSAKVQVIEELFPGELTNLTRKLHRVALSHWSSSDLAADVLRRALVAFITALPVYRTYVAGGVASSADIDRIENAIAAAREIEPMLDPAAFDFLCELLTARLAARAGYSIRRIDEFIARLQQFTGPVMAKSVEDTLFYRDVRLLALNEVGGDPSASGLAPNEFHRRMVERQARWNGGLTATATHDTKRGEDARLRIAALTEMSENWMAAVRRWLAANDSERASAAPTRAHEYLIYQSLIGAWDLSGISPDLVGRLQAYAIKAAREGKTATSWMQPDEAYEDRVRTFVAGLLDLKLSATFIAEFEPLARRAALLGALNSLSQLTLKATMPGIPDFYQGTEFWDLSLVDPDNRRPVDFGARAGILTDLNNRPDWHQLCQTWQSGAVKLALTRALLALRATHATIFETGNYVEIPVRDDSNGIVVAFSRNARAGSIVVAVCTRLAALTRGGRDWPDFAKIGGFLHLPSGQSFHNVLDNARATVHQGDVVLKDLFGPLPVAVLVTRG